jgi:hypothetical protein
MCLASLHLGLYRLLALMGGWFLAAVVLGACHERARDTQEPAEGVRILEVEATVSELVPTVATVRWVTDEPSTGSVAFSTEGEDELHTPSTTLGTEHEVLLLGLLSDRSYRFRIAAEAEGVTATSAEQSLETGVFAPDLPLLQHTALCQGEVAAGYTIAPVMAVSHEACWSRIVDGQARTVWAAPVPCKTHRTHLAPDGRGLLISHHIDLGIEPGDEAPLELLQLAWDGTLLSTTVVEGGHHDVTVVGDEGYAVLGFDPREIEIEGLVYPVLGDSIIEIDTAGRAQVIWSLLDELDPRADEVTEQPLMFGYRDWSHCNYLNYVAAEDAYYLTCRALNAMLKVDRSSRRIAWILRSEGGDFEHDEQREILGAPHSVELVGDELLVFNQHNSGCSEAARIRLDHDLGTAARTWSYEHESCSSVGYLGNAWPLPNGNSLVTFSELGSLYELSPSGEELRSIDTEYGWFFAYATQIDSLYAEVAP